VAENQRAIGRYVASVASEDAFTGLENAALLAALYEAEPTGEPTNIYNDVWALNRQWWVGLKRKLYGLDEEYPHPFVCPKPIGDKPARVLRIGSCDEAGMKADAGTSIDKVLQMWSEDEQCDQAFAVCVARRGVVFLHKAYGTRDGRPMTVDTKSWMASTTKLMSAALMMMLVDQGLVDIDKNINRYLPQLRGIEVENPLTIRHLYTHKNGFVGHWGDDRHDLEEIVASHYPHLEVGKAQKYNGVGYALGGKIIESLTGESVITFCKRHLLDPLDCPRTDFADTFGGALSVPMDFAKFGQMLLNKGAYGDQRFFSESTFEQMLPRNLTPLLGEKTTKQWGIGMVHMVHHGLSDETFGHGAASSAILRIDPINELVIVMTRNRKDASFDKHFPTFITAVVQGIRH
jgi:CubicO group peptidase (beta-lactamase class C family)